MKAKSLLHGYSLQQRLMYAWKLVYRDSGNPRLATNIAPLAVMLGEQIDAVIFVIYDIGRNKRIEKKLLNLFCEFYEKDDAALYRDIKFTLGPQDKFFKKIKKIGRYGRGARRESGFKMKKLRDM